jgi:hypothetical protein
MAGKNTPFDQTPRKMRRPLSKIIFMKSLKSNFARVFSIATFSFIFLAPCFAFAAGGTSSLNWAGYASVGNGPYTAVSGSWIVPTSSDGEASNERLSADAVWVGVGGIGAKDLIQAGTQAIIQGDNVSYVAWYELLPDSAVTVPLSVRNGDSVSVSISEIKAGTWNILIFNNTTGGEYQTTVSYDSSHRSAEWIVEAPTSDRGILPLDYFGSLSFNNAKAIANGSSVTPLSLGANAFTMINARGDELATPSALGSDGASFSVTRNGPGGSSETTGSQAHYPVSEVETQMPMRPQSNVPTPFVLEPQSVSHPHSPPRGYSDSNNSNHTDSSTSSNSRRHSGWNHRFHSAEFNFAGHRMQIELFNFGGWSF